MWDVTAHLFLTAEGAYAGYFTSWRLALLIGKIWIIMPIPKCSHEHYLRQQSQQEDIWQCLKTLRCHDLEGCCWQLVGRSQGYC